MSKLPLRCEPISFEKIKIVNRANSWGGSYSIWEVWVNDDLICSCYGAQAASSVAIIAKEFEEGTVPRAETVCRYQGGKR